MPRHEPAGRESAGEPPPERVTMRLDANGRFVPVHKRVMVETIEVAERPPTPDDPRPAAFRNIPPIGGVV
jgi:hypothetical protein